MSSRDVLDVTSGIYPPVGREPLALMISRGLHLGSQGAGSAADPWNLAPPSRRAGTQQSGRLGDVRRAIRESRGPNPKPSQRPESDPNGAIPATGGSIPRPGFMTAFSPDPTRVHLGDRPELKARNAGPRGDSIQDGATGAGAQGVAPATRNPRAGTVRPGFRRPRMPPRRRSVTPIEPWAGSRA